MKFADRVVVLNTLLNLKSNSGNTLTDEIKEWADNACFEHKGYFYKTKAMLHGKITCMDCLKEFSAFNADIKTVGNTSTVVCPHCGKTLTIERTKKQTDNQYGTFQTDQTVNGVKVTRVFEAHRCRHVNQRDEKTGVIKDSMTTYWFEVVRRWDNGKSVEFSSRNIGMFEYYRTSPWGSGDITYNRKSSRYTKTQAYTDSYLEQSLQCPHAIPEQHLQADYLCDIVGKIYDELKSQAKKEQIIHFVINYPMFETLVKADYLSLACVIANRSLNYHGQYYDYRMSRYRESRATITELLAAAKICVRNRYHIDDAVMYMDYIDDLHNLGRDMHNAHYVCPPDLIAAHAQSTKQIEAKRRREDERRNAEERARMVADAKRHDVEYRRKRHEYLGIEFTEPEQGLRFFVIQSASDMQIEGNKMHHCVGRYWDHRYALIFSCRRPNNERLATIEVSLDSFKISQTRGVSNSVPEFKDLIEATIMKHMDEIRLACKRQKHYEEELAKAEEKLEVRLAQAVDPDDPALLINGDLGGPCIHGLMAI